LKKIQLMLLAASLLICMPVKSDVIYWDDFEQFPKDTKLTVTNYMPAVGAIAAFSTNGHAGAVNAVNIDGSIRASFQSGKVPYTVSYQGVPDGDALTNQCLSLSFLLKIDARKKAGHYGGFTVSLLTTNLDVACDGENCITNGFQTAPLIWLNDAGQVYLCTTNAATPAAAVTIGSWSNLVGKITTNVLVLNYPAGKFSYSLNSRILTNMPLPGLFTNVLDRIVLSVDESVTNAGMNSLGNKFALDDVQLTSAGMNQDVATYIAAAKCIFYDQTNSTALVLSTNAYAFVAQVHATGTNTVLKVLDQTPTGATITVPQTPPLSTAFQYEQTFTNRTAFDKAYPAGSYNLTIQTLDQGIFTPGLRLPSDNYPNTPQVTNYNAARMIDSTNDFTLSWTAFSNGTTNDMVSVEIDDSAGNAVFMTPDFGAANQLSGIATSVLIPAGTLAPAEVYTTTVAFLRFVVRDTNSVPNVTGVAGYFKTTQLTIGTITTNECTYIVGPTNFVFAAAATNGMIQVLSNFACPWFVTNGTDFISITGDSSGVATGTVTFTVTENTTAYDRAGVITVAGQSIDITQGNPGCLQTLSPASATAVATGATNSFTVASNGTNCEWTVASDDAFIIITSTNAGIGAGVVEYSVDANPSIDSRTGRISVGNGTFTVTQDGREAFADLLVSKYSSLYSAYVGSNVVYQLNISNFGPDEARNVVFTDVFPDDMEYIVATTTQGLVYRTVSTNTILTAELGTILPGSNVIVTITGKATATGELTNVVSVVSDASDVDTNNNTALVVVTALPPAFTDLSVADLVTPNPVFYGSNLTFTVTVQNNGPSDATGVILTNTLPAGVTNVAVTAEQGSYTQMNNQVICNLDSLLAGSNAVVSISLQPVQQNNICCTSTVSSALADSLPSNNTSVACSSVVAHDLAVLKIKAPKTVQLTLQKPISTQLIKVTIQNRSPQNEVITAATVSNLCALVLTSLHTNSPCAAPVATLHDGPPQKPLPVTLKSKQKFTIVFDVRFTCATDPGKAASPAQADFSYTATVNHEVLDNEPDADPYDNVCPRGPLPYPGNLDPFPNGKIHDLGAGGKNPDGTYGAPVTTDVIDSTQ
jgi:uncharacterized repeat protein (TIGR01451 family)